MELVRTNISVGEHRSLHYSRTLRSFITHTATPPDSPRILTRTRITKLRHPQLNSLRVSRLHENIHCSTHIQVNAPPPCSSLALIESLQPPQKVTLTSGTLPPLWPQFRDKKRSQTPSQRYTRNHEEILLFCYELQVYTVEKGEWFYEEG
jgi:hypothetical protein